MIQQLNKWMNLLLFKSYSLKGLAVILLKLAAVAFALPTDLPGGLSSFGTPRTYLYLFEKYVRKYTRHYKQLHVRNYTRTTRSLARRRQCILEYNIVVVYRESDWKSSLATYNIMQSVGNVCVTYIWCGLNL